MNNTPNNIVGICKDNANFFPYNCDVNHLHAALSENLTILNEVSRDSEHEIRILADMLEFLQNSIESEEDLSKIRNSIIGVKQLLEYHSYSISTISNQADCMNKKLHQSINKYNLIKKQ